MHTPTALACAPCREFVTSSVLGVGMCSVCAPSGIPGPSEQTAMHISTFEELPAALLLPRDAIEDVYEHHRECVVKNLQQRRGAFLVSVHPVPVAGML